MRTTDRSCPNEVRRDRVRLWFLRKEGRQSNIATCNEFSRKSLVLTLYGEPMSPRELNCCPLNKARDRIQVIAEGLQTKPGRLKRNRTPTCCWIQHSRAGETQTMTFTPGPCLVFGGWHVAEGAGVAVRVTFESLPLSTRGINAPSRRHRISVNSDHVSELLTVRVCGKQGSQDRGSRRYERATRPPNVKVIGRRQCRHGAPLPHALLTQSSNWQPVLDQSSGHRVLFFCADASTPAYS